MLGLEHSLTSQDFVTCLFIHWRTVAGLKCLVTALKTRNHNDIKDLAREYVSLAHDHWLLKPTQQAPDIAIELNPDKIPDALSGDTGRFFILSGIQSLMKFQDVRVVTPAILKKRQGVGSGARPGRAMAIISPGDRVNAPICDVEQHVLVRDYLTINNLFTAHPEEKVLSSKGRRNEEGRQ